MQRSRLNVIMLIACFFAANFANASLNNIASKINGSSVIIQSQHSANSSQNCQGSMGCSNSFQLSESRRRSSMSQSSSATQKNESQPVAHISSKLIFGSPYETKDQAGYPTSTSYKSNKHSWGALFVNQND